jgi:exodeoxyribonuclease V alpha subunit
MRPIRPDAAAEPPGDRETLDGTVGRIRFHSAESFWTIAALATARQFQPLTIVGTMPGLAEGMRVSLTGRWEENPRFGRQFKVERWHEIVPATRAGLEGYLASGFIPGVGPKLAARIVERFGADALDVVMAHPERLAEVPGLGPKRAKDVVAAVRERRGAQDAMVFLLGLGIPRGLAVRIYKRYGDEAGRLVRENPYRLVIDVHGIGFVKADQVARGLQIAADHPERLAAGVVHVIREARSSGHVRLPQGAVVARAAALLERPEVEVEGAIAGLVTRGRLVAFGDPARADVSLYLPALYDAECGASHHLARLMGVPVGGDAPEPPPTRGAPVLDARAAEAAALAASERLKVTLARNQLRAVALALREPVVIITGGPGTGKTTIIRALLEATPLPPARVALAAPTGRAARRISETTGRPASTLHRLLEFNPLENTFAKTEEDPIAADLVIIDECSMVDLPLFHALVRAVATGARLVLVGDGDQLPPVGPGAPLTDMIASDRVPVARLTDIFRQGEGSLIVEAAHAVNRGEPVAVTASQAGLSDFYFLVREDPEAVLETIEKLVAERIPERFGLDPVRDVQVLTPMRGGPLGVEALNARLQRRLNPAPSEGASGPPSPPPRPAADFALTASNAPVASSEGSRERLQLRPRDKVMQIRNDYERNVFNGDIGYVQSVDRARGGLVVQMDDRLVTYDREAADDLVPAYAVTIHKSQGSEYPAVVVPVSTQHFIMLKRNLLYTAITRGKRLVVLVGTERAMRAAVSNATVERRESGFIDRLRAAIDSGVPLLAYAPRGPSGLDALDLDDLE